MPQYEEYRIIPPPWHWVVLAVFAVALVGWGLWIYGMVGESPRQWDFGALPDTPGEDLYSTDQPGREKLPPRQLAPLPEAAPIERVRP